MTRFRLAMGAAIALAALAQYQLIARQQDPQGFVRLAPQDLKWMPVEGGLGAQMAILDGDPNKPGLYVIRMKFPPGVMSRPHTHSEDRLAVVLSGTWWTGTGTEFKPDQTVPVPPGGFMKHPAGAPHFDGAKDQEVIVQIIGRGPVVSPRIEPSLGGYGYSLKK
jgi:quercetin dioxygenase-like cupin family protein